MKVNKVKRRVTSIQKADMQKEKNDESGEFLKAKSHRKKQNDVDKNGGKQDKDNQQQKSDNFGEVFQVELDNLKQNDISEESRNDNQQQSTNSNKQSKHDADINEIKARMEGRNMGHIYDLANVLQQKGPREAMDFLEKVKREDKEIKTSTKNVITESKEER